MKALDFLLHHKAFITAKVLSEIVTVNYQMSCHKNECNYYVELFKILPNMLSPRMFLKTIGKLHQKDIKLKMASLTVEPSIWLLQQSKYNVSECSRPHFEW